MAGADAPNKPNTAIAKITFFIGTSVKFPLNKTNYL
jgi:hypothetical protein